MGGVGTLCCVICLKHFLGFIDIQIPLLSPKWMYIVRFPAKYSLGRLWESKFIFCDLNWKQEAIFKNITKHLHSASKNQQSQKQNAVSKYTRQMYRGILECMLVPWHVTCGAYTHGHTHMRAYTRISICDLVWLKGITCLC